MTASHCGAGSSTSYGFNYERSGCGTGDPGAPTTQMVTGGTVRGNYASSDFTLIEMSSLPPESFNFWLNGWSHDSNPATMTWVIHHPQGDFKKISPDADPPIDGSMDGSMLIRLFPKPTTCSVSVDAEGVPDDPAGLPAPFSRRRCERYLPVRGPLAGWLRLSQVPRRGRTIPIPAPRTERFSTGSGTTPRGSGLGEQPDKHGTINITTKAAGAPDIQVRFHYYSASFEWWWQVDNVKLTYTAPGGCSMNLCSAPPAAPPPVPDGNFGTPATAARVASDGSIINLTWDVATCTGGDYHVLRTPLGSIELHHQRRGVRPRHDRIQHLDRRSLRGSLVRDRFGRQRQH